MASAKRVLSCCGSLLLALVTACGGGVFKTDSAGNGDSGSGGGGSAAAGGGAGRGGGGQASSAGAAAGRAGSPNPVGGEGAEAGAAGDSGGGGSSGAPESPIAREGLVYWFAADSGVEETSGRIARWADQSGEGRDAFQKESAERPKLTKYDEAQPPLVEFDGKSLLNLPAIDAPLDQGLTFFAVAGVRDTPCTALLELSNGLETQDVFFGIVAGAPQLEIADLSYATAPVFDYDVLKQLTMRQSATGSSAQVEISLNGTSLGKGPVGFAERVERTQNYIGNTQYPGCPKLVGGIGEIILYGRVLPPEELLEVESYLQQKWRIAD